MSKLDNEGYFAAGLAGAVFALYAFSMFTYFSSGEMVNIAQAKEGTVQTTTVTDHHAHVASRDQLTKIMSETQSHGIFSPLGTGDVGVPGAKCEITDQNLDFSYNFQGIPEDCIKTLDEE